MIQRGDERSGGLFSEGPHSTYRYLLWRVIPDQVILRLGATPRPGAILWCGLNPAKADEVRLDPTCTREIDFTARCGYRRWLQWNVFAYRSRDPKGLREPDDPIGRDNAAALDLALSERPALVVCAWGAHARYKAQDLLTLERLQIDERCGFARLKCMRLTKDRYPVLSYWSHPVFLPYSRDILEGVVPAGGMVG
jgi:hypothetical protein